MIISAIALALNSGWTLYPDITLATPAQTLEATLSQISVKSGEKLLASNLISREILQVHVKDAPYEEFLANIAKVVGGVWIKVGDARRLDLDLELARKETQEDLAERTNLLKEEIEKLVSADKTQPPLDPEAVRKQFEQLRQDAQNGVPPSAGAVQGMGGMMNRMPGGRAIVQTLATIKPEELARIELGQRVVFTSAPTPMQKPLGANSLSVMKTFVTEQAKWGSGGMGMRGPRGPQGRNQQPGAPQQTNPANQQVAPQNGPPSKAFLIVTRFSGDILLLNYRVADAQGHDLGNGNLTLGIDRAALQFSPAKTEEEPITLSAQTKLALTTLGRGGAGFGRTMAVGGFGGPGGGPGGPGGFGGALQVQGVAVAPAESVQPEVQVSNPEFLRLLQDPVANEPLKIATSEIWDKVAPDKNTIVLVPDSAISTLTSFMRSARSSRQILEAATKAWKYKVIETESWVTIAPKSLNRTRAERIDRAALKTLISAIKAKGSARLDDVALYATKSPSLGNGTFDLAAVRALDPASTQSVGQVYGQDRDILIMYAGLNTNARQMLAQGRSLAVNTVASNSMKLLANMVYNSQDGPRVERKSQSAPQGSPNADQFRGGRQGRNQGGPGGLFGGQDLKDERTEVLPQGVPGGSVVTVKTNQENVVKAVQKDSPIARVYTADMMGREKAMSELAAQFQQQQPQQGTQQNGQAPRRNNRAPMNWDGYVLGQRSQYTFVFTLAQGVTLTRTLDDSFFNPNSKTVDATQLPTDFLSGVEAAYTQMKERASQAGPGGQRPGRAPQGQGQGVRGGRRNTQQKPPVP